MIEILKSTVEYQKFGANWETFFATGTLVFTLFQAWSFLKQSQRIWGERSGQSVSALLFGYSFFYFVSFFIYGIAGKSIAMTANGLLFLFHIPILAGLYNFKGFTDKEIMYFAGFSLMPMVMFFTRHKEGLLLGCLFGILFVLWRQVVGIRKEGPGSFEPKMAAIFMAVALFWFFYAVVFNDWSLMIFNPIAFALWGAALLVYYKDRKTAVGKLALEGGEKNG